MIAHRNWLEAAGLIGALSLALLYPLSAYALGPAVLPALLAAGAALVATLRRPEYGLAVGLALVPLASISLGGRQPLLLVLAGLVFGLLLYGALTGARAGRLPATGLAVIALLLVSGASTLSAIEPADALADLFWLTVAVVFLLATLQICHERRQVTVVVGGLVAGLGLAGAHGLFQRVTGDFTNISFVSEGEVINRISGGFGHPNQYAAFIAVLAPLAIMVLVSRSFGPRLRLLAGLALALALPALALSYTRGAIIGLALGLLLWLVLLRPRAAIGAVIVIVAVGALLVPSALEDRFLSDSSGDVTLRADIWGAALELYGERPVVGVGPDNFAAGYRDLPAIPAFGSQRRLLHTDELVVPPHAQNQFLNILAEQGTLGILAFLVFFISALRVAYRGSSARSGAARAVSLGVGAGLLAFAIQGQLDVSLFGERTEIALLALVALPTMLLRLEDPETPPTEAPSTPWGRGATRVSDLG